MEELAVLKALADETRPTVRLSLRRNHCLRL